MSEDEARRTIRRMEDEQEKLLAANPDAEPADDPIETLGRRIARILSFAIAAGLGYYLWTQMRM